MAASTQRSRMRITGWTLAVLGLLCTVGAVFAPASEANGVEAYYRGIGAHADIKGQINGQVRSGQPAGIQQLKIGDTIYAGYCIDFFTETVGDFDPYLESDWAAANTGSDLHKINWVLHSSYPRVGVDVLAGRLGRPITEGAAAAATQAAIWHFSDGFELLVDDPANPPEIVDLYNYLTGPANVGLGSSPTSSLEFDRASASGAAGTLIGPFVVHTTAASVDLTTDSAIPGVVVDDKGESIASAKDGDQVFVKVPAGTAPGSLTVNAAGTATVKAGRVFVKKGDPNGFQKLVLASAAKAPVEASATASWTETPPPQLEVSATDDCGASAVTVTVKNSGTSAASTTIAGPDGFTKTVDVAAGATETVSVPVAKGTPYTITVTAGSFSKTLTGTLSCDEPVKVTAVPDCAKGGVKVVIDNSGAVTQDVTVAGPKDFTKSVTVEAGAKKTVLVPVDANSDYSIDVTAGGSTRTLTGHLSCDTPPALEVTASSSCAEGTVTAAIHNAGTTPEAVQVDGPDGFTQTVTVPGGGTESVKVPVTKGKAYVITVTDGSFTKTLTGTLNCPNLQVTTTMSCVDAGVLVYVANSGSVVGKATITGPSSFSTELTVPPGETKTTLVPVLAGAHWGITVTGDGVYQSFEGDSTCVSPTTIANTTTTVTVLGGGVQPTAPPTGSLPRTGANTASFLILGLFLLSGGAALLVIQDVLASRQVADLPTRSRP